VEREVDIRKKVGAVFNRRQDKFESLLDWNNYLEEVEGLIFDLVEGTQVERQEAEEKLRKYREGNKGEIEENRRAGLFEAEAAKRREKAEKDAARQRRIQALREEEEDKKDVEKSRRQVLDRLASTDGDANRITQQAQKVILKKSSARRNLADKASEEGNGSIDTGLTIRGLKKKEAPVAEKPYDPFGGIDLTPSRYVLKDDYDLQWLEPAKNDLRHMAGGYSLHEYYSRAMLEAFGGLGVFIGDEVDARSNSGHSPVSSEVGTAAAVQALTVSIKMESKMELEDIF